MAAVYIYAIDMYITREPQSGASPRDIHLFILSLFPPNGDYHNILTRIQTYS